MLHAISFKSCVVHVLGRYHVAYFKSCVAHVLGRYHVNRLQVSNLKANYEWARA